LIRSFKSKDTERLFNDYRVRRFQAFEIVARRKLKMLNDSASLNDLAALPGNRLEGLRGDRRGQHSIRINDRYRIFFEWRDGDADAVEIVDYH
jgi:proteic killer suppression protein